MKEQLRQKIEAVLGEDPDFCEYLADEIEAAKVANKDELWNVLQEHLQPLASSKGLINPRFASGILC